MHTPKMYVLTRLDLSPTYRAVQGGHALSKYALENTSSFQQWNNSTLVYLTVHNLIDLRKWIDKLRAKSIVFSVY